MKIKQGFTLVELMVVIAIIAILAVGSIVSYTSYLNKAYISQCLESKREIDIDRGIASSLGSSNEILLLGIFNSTSGLCRLQTDFSGTICTSSINLYGPKNVYSPGGDFILSSGSELRQASASDTSNYQRILPWSNRSATSAGYSPDGKKIVYTTSSSDGERLYVRDSSNRIHSGDQLTTFRTRDPEYGYDCSSIYYIDDRDDKIYKMSSFGGNPQLVVDDDIEMFDLTYDNEKLVYIKNSDQEIYVKDIVDNITSPGIQLTNNMNNIRSITMGGKNNELFVLGGGGPRPNNNIVMKINLDNGSIQDWAFVHNNADFIDYWLGLE